MPKRCEAERILKVKSAEADAQSKALQGRGIADQRKAIVEGLRESVDVFQKSVPGATAGDVMSLVLMTQYFDTLKEIGATARSNTLFIPHAPGHLGDLAAQMRDVLLATGQPLASSLDGPGRHPQSRHEEPGVASN